ncbi:MAG: TerB family tellurite resistance protein [Chloroflexi bacterium]|nr:TerB family tellurite resistance protein [Chloroflexota bacterium]
MPKTPKSTTETLAETENYLAWKADEPDGETTYHVELDNMTVHLFEEEWEEFLELAGALIVQEEYKKHPLEEYSENEQIAYLSILSAICYADKEFADEEKRQLDILLEKLKISDLGKSKIYSSVFYLQHDDKLANLETIQNLGNTELKYTLISDLCLFALIDSKFIDEEYQYILGIAEILGITQEQVDAIKSIQENLDRIKNIPSNSERFRQVIKESVATLAGVGIPIGAIAASGSVFGLSAAGISSGLAFLGAGFGMVAGAVVVVPAIAIGAAYGVKKLFDVVWKDNKNSDNVKNS